MLRSGKPQTQQASCITNAAIGAVTISADKHMLNHLEQDTTHILDEMRSEGSIKLSQVH